MDTYHVWADLKEGVNDLTFCEDLAAFMEHLADQGAIEAWRLQRRKLGFGPDGLGEFHVTMEVRDLAQLDEAFKLIAPRAGVTEEKHARIWSRVTNFRSGLWRDFPDPVRASGADRR